MDEKRYAIINLKKAGKHILVSIEVCVGGNGQGLRPGRSLGGPVLDSQHPQFWENPVFPMASMALQIGIQATCLYT